MLRVISTFLIIFYAIVAIRFSLSISYCGKRIVQIQFFSEAEYCCGSTPKKCCNKVNLSFDLQENIKPIDFCSFDFSVQKNIEGVVSLHWDYIPVTYITHSNPPIVVGIKPPSVSRLYLKFCSLKLGETFCS